MLLALRASTRRLARLARRMSHQSTDTVVIVSPDDFKFNAQTSATNTFQNNVEVEQAKVSASAMEESKRLETALTESGVRVIRLASRTGVSTPDAVFPNNWFSVHRNSSSPTVSLVLYPMLNANRQAERQVTVLTERLRQQNIDVDDVVDMTGFEAESKALEGTGSLVLDRVNRIAYASVSPRMNSEALRDFAQRLNYTTVEFSSHNEGKVLIYHTNVMMSVGTHFAVLCRECISDKEEAQRVVHSLESTGKHVIYITLQQLHNMCGNILEVRSRDTGAAKIAMSETAYRAFSEEQRQDLSRFGDIVHVDIGTIEAVGGGSVRCMLAEIFY